MTNSKIVILPSTFSPPSTLLLSHHRIPCHCVPSSLCLFYATTMTPSSSLCNWEIVPHIHGGPTTISQWQICSFNPVQPWKPSRPSSSVQWTSGAQHVFLATALETLRRNQIRDRLLQPRDDDGPTILFEHYMTQWPSLLCFAAVGDGGGAARMAARTVSLILLSRWCSCCHWRIR